MRARERILFLLSSFSPSLSASVVTLFPSVVASSLLHQNPQSAFSVARLPRSVDHPPLLPLRRPARASLSRFPPRAIPIAVSAGSWRLATRVSLSLSPFSRVSFTNGSHFSLARNQQPRPRERDGTKLMCVCTRASECVRQVMRMRSHNRPLEIRRECIEMRFREDERKHRSPPPPSSLLFLTLDCGFSDVNAESRGEDLIDALKSWFQFVSFFGSIVLPI